MLCFFRKNPFLLLFVLLEMTLSMALFADQLGELQYRHYALDLYQDSELVGCDHFTAHIVPGLTDSPDSAMAAIFEAAQNTDGVEAIGINRTFGGINAADLNLERKLQRRYTVSLAYAVGFSTRCRSSFPTGHGSPKKSCHRRLWTLSPAAVLR